MSQCVFHIKTAHSSEVNLVNKDQVDILHSLRETLNQDKEALEAELVALHVQLTELSDKNKMQLEQVNSLLMEKVSMQSEGLEQRERMLQREREHGDLRMILAGKDIPEDVKSKMMQLHEDNETLKEQFKTANDKLAKARQVHSDHRRANSPQPDPYYFSSSSPKTSYLGRSMPKR